MMRNILCNIQTTLFLKLIFLLLPSDTAELVNLAVYKGTSTRPPWRINFYGGA